MADDLEDLMLQFPGLFAQRTKSKGVLITGIVKIADSPWYHLRCNCPNFPNIHGMRLQIQDTFKMKDFSSDSDGINNKWCVRELIEHLPQLSDGQLTNSDNNDDDPDCKDLEMNLKMLQEIRHIYSPDCYNVELSADNKRIRFSQFSLVADKRHYLEVSLPDKRVLDHSLPHGVSWEDMLQKCQSLSDMVAKFQAYLSDLLVFYENMETIDELCIVVQPSVPSTKHNYRVFMLRDRVYLKLIIADPFALIASMSLQIIGPTHEVEQLRCVYSKGLQTWDPDSGIHKNLLRIFNLIFFPITPMTSIDADKSMEEAQQRCNICLCYNLDNGETPIFSCDNERCGLIFHSACLKEWFDTLSDGKKFLNVTFGICPFCKSKLSASFVELLES